MNTLSLIKVQKALSLCDTSFYCSSMNKLLTQSKSMKHSIEKIYSTK